MHAYVLSPSRSFARSTASPTLLTPMARQIHLLSQERYSQFEVLLETTELPQFHAFYGKPIEGNARQNEVRVQNRVRLENMRSFWYRNQALKETDPANKEKLKTNLKTNCKTRLNSVAKLLRAMRRWQKLMPR